MKKTLTILCVGLTMLTQAQTKKTTVKKTTAVKTTTVVLKNSLDSFSYAMGLQGAGYYKGQGISKMNTALLKKGFDDGYNTSKPLLSTEQCNSVIQKTMQATMAVKDVESNKQANIMKEESKKFLAENKKKPGVIELPSGLQYQVITQGNGPIPKATDTVKAHYAGTLINGTEFDNSYKRGEPIEIPVTGVIQGWVQALQMMPVGSKWRLFIPSDLGYGDRGAGNGAIPGGATLIFEIELIEIVNK